MSGLVNQYTTLVEAINGMRNRGYTLDFSLDKNVIACATHQLELSPDDFQVEEYHRFEGESDPADMSIVYGIAAKEGTLKGILVNGYGPTASEISQALVARLSVPEQR